MKFNKNKFIHETKTLIILVIVAFTIKTTLIEIYVVPTGSMENTIMVGDMLVGNKFIYGMRTPTWIGIPYTRIGFDIPWFRLPQFKNVTNGDVTIFEYPRDTFQKYVKRCIGIAKDKISIIKGEVKVNGLVMGFPEKGKYLKGYTFEPEKIEGLYSYFNGNRDNIADFIVPYKGMKINFNDTLNWETIITLLIQDGNHVKINDMNFVMTDPYEISRTRGFLKYKLLRLFFNPAEVLKKEQKDRKEFIANYQKKYQDEKIVNPWRLDYSTVSNDYLLNNISINGTLLRDIDFYEFKNNFFFFMGDNRDSSYDSRYWGFVPETQVLGTPVISLLNLMNLKLKLKRVK